MLVPAKTPAAIVERLNKELVAIVREPSIKQWLTEHASDAIGSTPQAFGKFIEQALGQRTGERLTAEFHHSQVVEQTTQQRA